jgi:N-acetylneuraminic acid mutarotase
VVALTAGPVRADLSTAVDNSSLGVTTGGNANWYEDSSNSNFGTSSARSGYIGHSQSTWMQATLNGTGTLTFYWKVSSELCCDHLQFLLDGIQQDQIQGTTSWALKTFTISGTGSHIVKWQYVKDGSIVAGSDAGWVDHVTWSGGGGTIITWVAKASMPTARLQLAVAADTSNIYAVGGWTSYPRSTLEMYAPATNTWVSKTSMPTARNKLGAAMVNGKLYAMGGQDSGGSALTTNEQYDPGTNMWTGMTAMPAARQELGVGTYAGNYVYAIGGYFSGAAYTTAAKYYPPSSNYWSSITAGMSYGRYGLAVAVIGDQAYAIGGQQSGVAVDFVEKYDPMTNSWTVMAPMPAARYDLAVAVLGSVMDGYKIYAIGGVDSSGNTLSDVEEYDVNTDTWVARTSLTTARYGHGAAAVNGKLYVIGGQGTSGTLSSVEEGTITTSTGSGPGSSSAGLSSAIARTGQGKIVVAPNVLDRSDSLSTRLGLTVRGSSGGKVTFVIFNAAGGAIDSVDITLDSSGCGTRWYTGPGNSVLAPGVYWVKASGGGVSGKKPFMVVTHRNP